MKVYYRRLIEGMATAAIIHNGAYFLIDMPVYEDGSIDCWERIPLGEAAEKLNSGWLVTSIPDGKSVCIDQLGEFHIKNARWNFSPESYEQHLWDLVKKMNGGLVGLFQETSEQKAKWEKHRTCWTTRGGVPYKISGNFGYYLMDGCRSKAFICLDDKYHLANVIGFCDDTFEIEGYDSVSKQDLEKMFFENKLVCAPPVGAVVNLQGLGIAEISKIGWAVEPKEKLKEILELPNLSGGRETAHNRKDWDYRRILEHPHKKREV